MNTITITDSQTTTVSGHRTKDPELAIQRAIAKRYGKRGSFHELQELENRSRNTQRYGLVARGEQVLPGWVWVGIAGESSK